MKLISLLRLKIASQIRQNPQRLLRALVQEGLVIRTVIHCGAHLAQERHFYEKLGCTDVFWLEGSPSIHQQLSALLQKEKDSGSLKARHQAVHALLFDKPGMEISLHGFDNGGQSNSIFHATESFEARFPSVKETGEQESAVSTTLDLVASAQMPKGADLIVLDLQGAEIVVLNGGRATLQSARAVICEVSKLPIYEGGALLSDIRQYFKAAGFVAMHRPHTVGDLLFVRPEALA